MFQFSVTALLVALAIFMAFNLMSMTLHVIRLTKAKTMLGLILAVFATSAFAVVSLIALSSGGEAAIAAVTGVDTVIHADAVLGLTVIVLTVSGKYNHFLDDLMGEAHQSKRC